MASRYSSRLGADQRGRGTATPTPPAGRRWACRMGVGLHHAAVDEQLAAGALDRGAAEPQRVVVARHQRHLERARAPHGRAARGVGSVGGSQSSARQPRPRSHASRDGSARAASATRSSAASIGSACPRGAPGSWPSPTSGSDVWLSVNPGSAHAGRRGRPSAPARKGGLVRADPARDPLSGDRKRGGLRERRIEGADDAVLQDHASRISPTPPVTAGRSPGASAGAGRGSRPGCT